jgi:hypothetical protein
MLIVLVREQKVASGYHGGPKRCKDGALHTQILGLVGHQQHCHGYQSGQKPVGKCLFSRRVSPEDMANYSATAMMAAEAPIPCR